MSRSLLATLVVLVACVGLASASLDASLESTSLSFGAPSFQAESWPGLAAVGPATDDLQSDLFLQHQFDMLEVTGESSSSSSGPSDEASSTASTTVSSTASSNDAALSSYSDASSDLTADFSSSTLPTDPTTSSKRESLALSFMRVMASTDATYFDRKFASDIAAATNFPVERVSVSHTFENCEATDPTVCAGPTNVHVVFSVLSSADASASTAAALFVAQINCAVADSSCDPANGIRHQSIANGSSTVFGSATLSTGVTTVSVTKSGKARHNNAAYYVLGAILAVFVILAIVWFILHKAPVEEVQQKKTLELVDTADARGAGADEVAADDVNPQVDGAEVAAGGVAAEELAPTEAAEAEAEAAEVAPAAAANDDADAAQMDYKSVFALRNNVLDTTAEDGVDAEAAAIAEADDNDVHFVLHQ